MRKLLFLILALHSLPSLNAADSGLKRYLYLSTPDGAQGGGSGKGILVFDIDHGHRFVRRIDVEFKEGLRGFCGNAKRHAVYYTTTNRRLGAFDLETESVLWERQGGHGWVTFSLDGRYAWCHTPDVLDARTRKIVATLQDENGKPVCGSKFIEVQFRDGKVVEMGDQFGLGRAHPKLSVR